MAQQSKLESWDKKYLWHPFTQQSVWEKDPTFIVKSGKGVFLKDINGKKLIDGVSSLWVNLHGHGHSNLNRALQKQIKRISHSTFLGLSHVPAILLGKTLVSLAPKQLKRVFYSDNGATAVEVALKMAFQYWIEKGNKKKTEFLALRGSYHGDTIGSVSVGGIGTFHSKFGRLLFKTQFAMSPDCSSCPFNRNKVRHQLRTGHTIGIIPRPGIKRTQTGCRWECLGDVEKILKKMGGHIAAAIIEPVIQGAAGMRVQPEGYAAGFARLCKKYKTLLIADEVATGFGRTGTLFATQQENLSPDIMCLAKGMTGGYSPLAATLTTEKIYKAFWGPVKMNRTFFHGHSYTAHPLGAAVALTNLDLLQKRDFFTRLKNKINVCKRELRVLSTHPKIRSVRQAGLMIGIELDTRTPGAGAKVCKALLKRGIWLRPLGNTIVFMPPYVMTENQIKYVFKSIILSTKH